MKKQTIIIAVSLLSTIYSCSPGGGTATPVTPTSSTPVSKLNITINGHTYHFSGNAQSTPPLAITASTFGSGNTYSFNLTCSDLNKTVGVTLPAYKTDMTSAVGTYYEGYDSTSAGITHPGGQVGSYITIIDFADGGKTYTNMKGVYAGQISKVNVTISNGTEVAGTFSLKLSYNGAIYNITGDFDYKH